MSVSVVGRRGRRIHGVGKKLGCGHPMGPLTLCDFIGLDVLYAVCDALYEDFKQPEYAPPPLLKRMVVSRPPQSQDRMRVLRLRAGRGAVVRRTQHLGQDDDS